jgi:hypothetical protein
LLDRRWLPTAPLVFRGTIQLEREDNKFSALNARH